MDKRMKNNTNILSFTRNYEIHANRIHPQEKIPKFSRG